MSSHDPRVVLGIGNRTKFDWIEIKWPEPSGLVQRLTDLPLDRYITIREGQGKWESAGRLPTGNSALACFHAP